jgi:AcrR family transcriptional regulator
MVQDDNVDLRHKPVSSQRRTQTERREESGRRLILAAIEVIAEQGVSAATFEAIGRRAGYSRGLATQKFGSKQGLIDAVVDHLHARHDFAVQAAGLHELPGLDGLLAYVSLHLRNPEEDRQSVAYYALMASTISEMSGMRQSFAASHHRIEQLLEGFVRKGQADGTIPHHLDPEDAALTIGSQLLGISVQRLVDPTLRVAPLKALILQTLKGSSAWVSKAR